MMNIGINTGYGSKIHGNTINKSGSLADEEKSFSELAYDRISAQKAERSAAAGTSSPEMTMQEYRKYISEKIVKLPVDESQRNVIFAVDISDAGYEAMKNNPQYEKWVLGMLEYNFGADHPWGDVQGSGFVVYHIGAAKEEFSAQAWYPGHENGNGVKLYAQESKKGFWEKRMKQHKKRMELSEEIQIERAIINRKTQQENLIRAELGLEEKQPYLAGVPAAELLSIIK